MRLEDFRHLDDGQALGKRHVDDVHVAAGDFVDHLERRHRAVEPVIARLQMTTLTVPPQRDAVHSPIADNARCDKPIADGQAASALRELDELLGALISAVWLVDAPVHERRRARGDEQ